MAAKDRLRAKGLFATALVLLLMASVVTPVSPDPPSGTSTALVPTQEPRERSEDVGGTREKRQAIQYYDFLINEWSFKFWAVFQLVTIAVLLYSTFAAIYYAKWTYLQEVDSPDYVADFIVRSDSDSKATLDTTTFQRILDAIAKKPS